MGRDLESGKFRVTMKYTIGTIMDLSYIRYPF